MKKIPLFDLSRQHNLLKNQIFKTWEKVYQNGAFTSGIETEIFEQKFAKICQTKFALGVHSGTDSLIITLKAAGIKDGDEIITTPCTFSASSDCIVHVGATPIFADVDPKTGNLNPSEIEKKISPKTKAILLVHLYGIPCDMDAIMKIAKKNNLMVIEDASHAHGSLYKNQPVGSFGIAGCFSLYPSKTLGALGNAGIITSNNESFIKKARMYANHGIKNNATKYTHHLSGFNKLIDNLQSAALIHKLPSLQKTIAKKLEIAKKYNQAFAQANREGMFWPEHVAPSIYVYAYQANNRKADIKYFENNQITTGIYYPTPLHLQPSMKKLGYKKGDFPHAEKFFSHTLSLPLFSQLSSKEQEKILNVIEKINNSK